MCRLRVGFLPFRSLTLWVNEQTQTESGSDVVCKVRGIKKPHKHDTPTECSDPCTVGAHHCAAAVVTG